jgi:hypothetical protein
MGYVNYSFSEGAASAYRAGRYSLTECKSRARAMGAKIPGWLTASLAEELIHGGEWHHTSKEYNRTNFYELSRVIALARQKRNPREVQAERRLQLGDGEISPQSAAFGRAKSKMQQRALAVKSEAARKVREEQEAAEAERHQAWLYENAEAIAKYEAASETVFIAWRAVRRATAQAKTVRAHVRKGLKTESENEEAAERVNKAQLALEAANNQLCSTTSPYYFSEKEPSRA